MRQLFPSVQGTDPEDLMPSDNDSQSVCSTRHSTSYHARASEDKFSTDVSSTRKLRK